MATSIVLLRVLVSEKGLSEDCIQEQRASAVELPNAVVEVLPSVDRFDFPSQSHLYRES